MVGGTAGEVVQHLMQDAEWGVDVNGIILVPGDGKEVDMGAVPVVESGTKLG